MSGIDQYTKLLLHFDEATHSTTIVDSSNYGWGLTTGGSFETNGLGPTGFGGAGYFPEDASAYVAVQHRPVFDFANGAWSFDFWVYLTENTDYTTAHKQYVLYKSGATYNYYKIYITQIYVAPTHRFSVTVNFLNDYGGTGGVGFSTAVIIIGGGGTAFTTGFKHIEIVHVSGVDNYIFVDGIAQTLSNNVYAGPFDTFYATPMYIGYTDTAYKLEMYLDEVRLSVGVARHTTIYTPPVTVFTPPTAPYSIVGEEPNDNTIIVTSELPVFAGVGLTNVLGAAVFVSEFPVFSVTAAVGSTGRFAQSMQFPVVHIHGVAQIDGDIVLVPECGIFAGAGIVNAAGVLAAETEFPVFACIGITGSDGVLKATAQECEFVGIGLVNTLGSMAVTTEPCSFSAGALQEQIGRMTCTAQACVCGGAGIVGSIGRFVGTCQFPAFKAGSVVLYINTYCVNLVKKGLISTFSGYGYNSLIEINGHLIGSHETGLFLLEGDTDNTVDIDSTITFPLSKLGTAKEKQLRAVKLFGRTDGTLLVTANDGKAGSWPISIPLLGDDTAESIVKTFPFTARGRYLQLKVENVDGCDFLLDQVELAFYILGKV